MTDYDYEIAKKFATIIEVCDDVAESIAELNDTPFKEEYLKCLKRVADKRLSNGDDFLHELIMIYYKRIDYYMM